MKIIASTSDRLVGQKMEAEIFAPDKQYKIAETLEFSVGEAFYPMDAKDYHFLMHLADERMYEEKRNRKNRENE